MRLRSVEDLGISKLNMTAKPSQKGFVKPCTGEGAVM